MHALAGHAETGGHLDHRFAVPQNGHHCFVSLLHDAALNEHDATSPRHRQRSVKDQPKPASNINRTSVVHHPNLKRPRSGGTTHFSCAPCGVSVHVRRLGFG
jgi:hypothetical protein